MIPCPKNLAPEDEENDHCAICGAPATREYSRDDPTPLCDNPRCEYQMHAAQEFHDECGDR